MAINIASFNLYTFSSAKNRQNLKSFDKIASIINNSNADLVALQEVIDQQSVDSLLSQLHGICGVRRRWRAFFDKKKTHRNNREGYAFLWDEGVVELARDDNGDAIEPEIMTRYASLKRPPMVGRFRTVRGMEYEICVINTHIIFKKDRYLNAQAHPEWYSARAMRALEYSKIVREIYPTFATHLNVYAVIAGDYNLSLGTLMKINELGNQKNDRPQMITVQRAETTIKVIDLYERDDDVQEPEPSSKEQQGFLFGIFNGVLSIFAKREQKKIPFQGKDRSVLCGQSLLIDGGYAHDYDHFSFDMARVAPYVRNPHRISISETMFPLPQHRFHDYKADVSDHVPIVATLDLSSSLK